MLKIFIYSLIFLLAVACTKGSNTTTNNSNNSSVDFFPSKVGCHWEYQHHNYGSTIYDTIKIDIVGNDTIVGKQPVGVWKVTHNANVAVVDTYYVFIDTLNIARFVTLKNFTPAHFYCQNALSLYLTFGVGTGCTFSTHVYGDALIPTKYDYYKPYDTITTGNNQFINAWYINYYGGDNPYQPSLHINDTIRYVANIGIVQQNYTATEPRSNYSLLQECFLPQGINKLISYNLK
jgi:hypothetical protein